MSELEIAVVIVSEGELYEMLEAISVGALAVAGLLDMKDGEK